MEPKIDDVHAFVGEVRSELRVIVACLTKIQTRLDGIDARMTNVMATKAGLAAFESTMVKWFIGTAIAIAGLSFAAARLIY